MLFLGDYKRGALLTEHGQRFEQRRTWHRYNGAKTLHWNKPITSGLKYAVVAYNNLRKPMVFPSKMKHAAQEGATTGDRPNEEEGNRL